MKNQESPEENPLVYYAVILVALSLVAYKRFEEIDKDLLIHSIISIVLAIICLSWILAIMIFGIKGYFLKEEKPQKIFEALIHLTNSVIVTSCVYRIFLHLFNQYFIIHLLISIFISSYYNYVFHDWIFKKKILIQEKNLKIESEQEEIRGFIDTDFDRASIDDLRDLKKYFTTKDFLKESMKLMRGRFYKKISSIEYYIEKKIKEEKLSEITTKTRQKLEELERIRKEKDNLLMHKESRKAEREYALTHTDEDVILCKGLTSEDKTILKEAKFKFLNSYCVNDKSMVSVFVKPIMNHSPTHTFLVWSTKKLLEQYEVTNIFSHDTRDADITFMYNHKYYAIEIETGNLLKKRKQLEDKVKYLNKKYKDRWFFIVSNRNLQAKYKKYGLTTQRNRVSKILENMLEK